MSFLYPIESQAGRWSLEDYGVNVIRVAIAPLVSLVAIPFFLFKTTKDSLMFCSYFHNFAAQQNEVSRDYRKIRFYAKRLIPLIGYYWGHRSEERREKYEMLLHLSSERLEALAFKRTRNSKKPGVFQREIKFTHMILTVTENHQIEAILRGVSQSSARNSVFSYVLRNLLNDSRQEGKKTRAVCILRFLSQEKIDLRPIINQIYLERRGYLLQLADENQIPLSEQERSLCSPRLAKP